MLNNCLVDASGIVVLEEKDRTRSEVWTRVMGYHRPISEFNPGKKSEHAERVFFQEFKTKKNPSPKT